MRRIRVTLWRYSIDSSDSTTHRPVAELADAADLKSAELNLIRVQVPAGLFGFYHLGAFWI